MNHYRVVLVEDEIPARTVFRHFIEERADLFTLVGEAGMAGTGWSCSCSISLS